MAGSRNRVWYNERVMQLKSKIKIMHGWRTEWCSHLPVIDGDAQIDEAKWEYRSFRTLKEAQAHAAEIIAKHGGGVFGAVQIDEFKWEPCDFAPWLCDFGLVGETIEVCA